MQCVCKSEFIDHLSDVDPIGRYIRLPILVIMLSWPMPYVYV